MSKVKHYIIYAVLSMILMGMVFYGVKAYTQATLYEDVTTELVTLQGVEEQASRQLENFAKSILGDLFNDERQVNFTNIKKKQVLAMSKAQQYTRYFMYLLGALLISFFYLSLREYTFFGALAAIITLVLGLITPILMVTIHKEVEYIGDIVLSFESKGVIGSIAKLFDSGDIIVALVILLFSVLVPVLKVLSLLFISIFMESDFAHKIVKFFKMIGKWSMVDVFVVAVFLVYLTANKGDVSRAEVEVGLYFFLAYVIVSMMVSLSADKMVQQLKA
ncbi:paraquat-inducible membrane protein A [Sulfurovum lithotrophicum]|nr:paraquat-inducible membrane protein A [Sulfurovum lithotrophicum]